MSAESVAAFVKLASESRLLEPGQVEELVSSLQANYERARDLAKELINRGWLTRYQVSELVKGNANQLFLGQYVLLDRLGRGGMGQVYKARHLRLDRIVALKVIRRERLANQESVMRFQREARAAARLAHPNIVTIYDADDVDGVHFLSMEYVEGVDLADLVSLRGRLPVPQACDFIRQAALGLQHAHERGLIHRDIKPGNLLVAAGDSCIKILDMGLARFSSHADGDPKAGALTQEGTVHGTPDYLAPEQAMDFHKVDSRADLYSLGCSLYFLLTGQPPFPGGTLTMKLLMHQQAEPQAVESLRPDLPDGLALVLRKMMAKKPEDRYRTAAMVAEILTPFARSTPEAVPPRSSVLASSIRRPVMSDTDTSKKAKPYVRDVKLHLQQGASPPREIKLRGSHVIIGSGPSCDLRIVAKEVSDRHCRIHIQGEKITVRDLGSVIGTKVNDRPVVDDQALQPGDKLQLGRTTFLVEYQLSMSDTGLLEERQSDTWTGGGQRETIEPKGGSA